MCTNNVIMWYHVGDMRAAAFPVVCLRGIFRPGLKLGGVRNVSHKQKGDLHGI